MLDLEDLLEDIKVYSDLEDSNLHFWKVSAPSYSVHAHTVHVKNTCPKS